MMKIVADENIPLVETTFKTLGKVTTLAGRDITTADLQDCDVLLVRSVTQVSPSLLANTPVRFVGTATSGINHIDTNYLRTHHIGFADARGCNAWSVAEYVMSAIAVWSLTTQQPLKQTTVGIIGYGHVGKKVKLLCEQFGMSLTIYDPPLAEMKQISNAASLHEVLHSDVITLHVPLTTTGKHPTQNLINQHHLNQLKKHALLINTSRGEVIHETALLERSQHLNLALDVWHNEPCINTALLRNTLVGTPHIAGYSHEGKIRGTEMIYRACCEFFGITPNGRFAAETQTSDKESSTSNDNIPIKTAQDILAQYDIMQDSKALKQMLSHPELISAAYFDGLRKNYPIRHEWHQLIL